MKENELRARILGFNGARTALSRLSRAAVDPLVAVIRLSQEFDGRREPRPLVSVKALRAVRRRASDLANEVESLENAHIPPGDLRLHALFLSTARYSSTWVGFAAELRRYADFLFQEIRFRSPKRHPKEAVPLQRWEDYLICEFVAATEDPDLLDEKHWRKIPELTVLLNAAFAAAGMMLLFRASPVTAVKGSIMHAGMVALISIAGLGWLGSSFFEGNRLVIIGSISGVIQQHPWVFAVGLFVLSILLSSQAATVVTLMPAAVAMGLSAPAMIAVFPAVNGYFFLPTYATLLAAISFDQTGTTRIGKYVLNHSFMLPGMVATWSSVIIGYLIAKLVF